MRRSIIGLAVAASIALSACGGELDAGGLAKSFVKSGKEEGIEVDEACVKTAFSKLDAEGLKELNKFADKGDDADMDTASAPVQEALGAALGCAGSLGGDLVDEMVTAMAASAPGADTDCLREAMSGLSGDDLQKLAEVNTSGDPTKAADLMAKITPCLTGG